MYAVVKTGGKQYRVEEGQTLEVDRAGEPGAELTLPAVLVVDGDTVLRPRISCPARPSLLASSTMSRARRSTGSSTRTSRTTGSVGAIAQR